MRRKLVLIAAVVAATGLVIGSMSLTSAASSRRTGMEAWGRDALRRLDVQLPKPQSHEGGQTLVLISKSTRPPNEKGVDTGGPGPIGDYFMFRERLFDRTDTRVGVIHGQCFLHFPLTQRVFTLVCNVDAALYGQGHIAAYGRLTFRETGASSTTLSVTGGTGHFQNVRGEMHLVDADDEDETRLIFHLLP